jgi:MFS family permease
VTEPRIAVQRLALSRLISITGSMAAYTALMFEILERTDSAAWLAATLLLTEGVSGAVGPFAAALGDRFDRRTVMIVSDGASAACFLAMAFIDSPGPLVAAAFLSALAEAPFWPASSAAIPNLVPPERVAWANSLVAIGRNIGITFGPVVGGVLLAAVGASWVFAINAISFVVSSGLIWSVRASFAGEREDEEEHRGLVAGFRFLWRQPVLRRIAMAWVLFVLGIGMAMVADAPLARLFDVGSVGFGVLIGVYGVGSILGSLAGRALTAHNEMRWLIVGAAGVSLFAFGIALSPWFALVLALSVAWGAADGLVVVADQNIFQRRTPDAVRSRVLGALEGIVHGTLVIAYLGAAVALPVVGARGMYALLGVGAGLSVVVLLPLLREPPSPEPEEELPVAEAPSMPEGGTFTRVSPGPPDAS